MTVRINWFPDPNITQTFGAYAPGIVKVDFPVVARRNWVRATVLAVGDVYVQYSLQGDRLPPAGTYHVHCCAFAKHANAFARVYMKVGGKYTVPLQKEIADGTTVDVDGTITVPDGCEEIIIRITAGNVVGAIGMMSDILIERADTYDTSVGGASGLLHRGYDATRLRRFVGRVMSDDGHEPDKQSKSPRHAEAGRVHADFDRREDSGYPILVHGLAGRVGRLRHGGQLSGHLQQEPTHRMGLHVHDRESDEPEIQGRVRQSDRQGVGHGHVRAGRIPGEQSLARRPLLFRRGYDAARLTPLGVVA